MPKENHCAVCGKPTGTKARHCRKHHREYMKMHRQRRIIEMRSAGYVLAQGIIAAADLLDCTYKRRALLEAVHDLISRRLARMKRKGSRTT